MVVSCPAHIGTLDSENSSQQSRHYRFLSQQWHPSSHSAECKEYHTHKQTLDANASTPADQTSIRKCLFCPEQYLVITRMLANNVLVNANIPHISTLEKLRIQLVLLHPH